MVTVCSSEFVMGARQVGALPSHDLHEIAILGRSNVGKSTFLNKIAGRRKLARTSSKPGHTQELNLYKIELAVEAQKKSVYLLDLPGFGYAKLAKKQRNQIADMILDYIEHRQELRLVCLLNDCRRSPQAEELIVRDIAFERDLRLFVIATKIDKLKRNEKNKKLDSLAKAYGLERGDLLVSGEQQTADFWTPAHKALSWYSEGYPEIEPLDG